MFLTRGNKKYLIPGMRVRTFGIPAERAADGSVTCPGAGMCRQGCYAKQGHYVCPNVKAKNEERFRLTQDPQFFSTIFGEIQKLKLDLVRIHDSGDFYSKLYLMCWVGLAAACRNTKFLAYSKMVPMIKSLPEGTIPDNLVIVLSEGGRWDHLIDELRDKFARVFPSVAALKRAGFVDCHKSDLPALRPEVRKIGLIYHGWKSRYFVTAPKEDA
jgi:hypothetical protein